jgi:hypothetical protein
MLREVRQSGVVMEGRDAKPGVERTGAKRQERRTKGQGGPTLLMSSSLANPNPRNARIDEVWLRIRAGAVGLHPCSAKTRSASHRLGSARRVRPVDSKLLPASARCR